MAYLKPVKRLCHSQTCSKQATQEVIGCRNESYGVYCSPCAKRKLAEVQRNEAGGRN